MTETLDDIVEEHTSIPDGEVLSFQTKKFALEALLSKAQNVIPTRDLLPVLKNFLVEVTEDGIKVAATDIELSVISQSGMVTVEKEGRAVFPAARFQSIVKEASQGEISVVVTAKDEKLTARIESGRASWNLRLMNGEDYPELPDPADITFFEVDRTKFVSAIKQVRYAASNDTMRLNLMMIDVTNGRMRASDGVRFQEVKFAFPFDAQIPINAVDDLVKVISLTEAKEFEVGETENSLVFRIGGDLFVAQKLAAEFPDVDEVLLKPSLVNDQELHIDRMELIQAIKRVRITADEETSAVILTLEEDAVTVHSKDKKGSTSSETVDAKWDSKERSASFNHQHLMDMLNMAEAKSCTFRLGKDTKTRPSPLLLVDEEAGMTGVLNQIRIDWLD